MFHEIQIGHARKILSMAKNAKSLIQWSIQTIISSFVTILIFFLTYIFYGKNEQRKIESDISNAIEQRISSEITRDLTKSKISISEIEKAIKTVEATYARQIHELRISADRVETENKVLKSELLRQQTELGRVELSTKKMEKLLS